MIVESPRVLYVSGSDDSIEEILRTVSGCNGSEFDYTDSSDESTDEEIYEPSQDMAYVSGSKQVVCVSAEYVYKLVDCSIVKEDIANYPLRHRDAGMVQWVDITYDTVSDIDTVEVLFDNIATIATINSKHNENITVYKLNDKVFTNRHYIVLPTIFKDSLFVTQSNTIVSGNTADSIDSMLYVQLVDLTNGVL